MWTALGNGDGTFTEPHANPVLHNFGYSQDWRVDRHPRLLANLTSSGFPDIVGFGNKGVQVALGNGDGTFREPFPDPVLDNFGYDQGWRVDKHPRFVTDLNGDGRADIVGFGDAGVWTALGNGDGSFADAGFALPNFGIDRGWLVDQHPRFVTDLNGDGFADIVGFGEAGVWTALGNGNGGFADANLVFTSFGAGLIVLAITQHDLTQGSHGIWRSTDSGSTWVQVHTFPPVGEALGQLQWALGSDHLVYATGGSSLAISKNGGATFTNVFPWGRGNPAGSVNHVAVWQNSPAAPAPAIIYALGDGTMFVSFDGGATWMQDLQTLPVGIGAAVSAEGNGNSPDVMVISPRWPLEIYVAGNGSSDLTAPVLHRGDYTQFPGTQTSTWDKPTPPVLPGALRDTNQASGEQDSGNVFLTATRRGRVISCSTARNGHRYGWDRSTRSRSRTGTPWTPTSTGTSTGYCCHLTSRPRSGTASTCRARERSGCSTMAASLAARTAASTSSTAATPRRCRA